MTCDCGGSKSKTTHSSWCSSLVEEQMDKELLDAINSSYFGVSAATAANLNAAIGSSAPIKVCGFCNNVPCSCVQSTKATLTNTVALCKICNNNGIHPNTGAICICISGLPKALPTLNNPAQVKTPELDKVLNDLLSRQITYNASDPTFVLLDTARFLLRSLFKMGLIS